MPLPLSISQSLAAVPLRQSDSATQRCRTPHRFPDKAPEDTLAFFWYARTVSLLDSQPRNIAGVLQLFLELDSSTSTSSESRIPACSVSVIRLAAERLARVIYRHLVPFS